MKTTTAPPATIDIFSWWTAEGEAEALDALVQDHRARVPETKLVNLAVENVGQGPEEVLNELMGLTKEGMPNPSAKPHPPELAQWDLYSLKTHWLDNGVKLAALDSVFEAEGWRSKLYGFVVKDIEFEGKVLALPLGLHRDNTLFFNRQMLAAAGVAEGSLTGWAGFVAACEKVKAAGKTCVATTQEDWVLDILFRNVAAMTMGAAKFQGFFGRTGDRDDPLLAQSLANFRSLFEKGYVGGWDNDKGAPVNEWTWDRIRKEGWDEAAKDLSSGRAAFYFHGDWALGLYKSLGWKQADLGVVATPGAQELFVYGADGILVPEGGEHREAALEVIRTWGNPKTIARFNKAKGSTPPRPDVDVSDDPLSNVAATDLRNAKITMSVPDWLTPALLGDVASGKATVAETVTAVRALYDMK